MVRPVVQRGEQPGQPLTESVPRAACRWPPGIRDARARACAASGDSAAPFVKASVKAAAPSAAVAAAVVRPTSSRSAGGSGAPVAARAADAAPRRSAAVPGPSARA